MSFPLVAFSRRSFLSSVICLDVDMLNHVGKLGEDLNFTALQVLSKSGYSSVQFGECDVLVRCSPKSSLQRNPCLSIFTTGAADKPAIGRLVWKVPSGIETQAGFVSSFTFLSVALASITIILSSLFCSSK